MLASDRLGPHRRYNPLLDEWVLCSPHRLARPWLGREETSATEPLPTYDPDCYLCPGNPRAAGTPNPPYTGTFAFDNDFPALLSPTETAAPDEHPLLRRASAAGVCRVICFSPRHDLSLARLSLADRTAVVETWCEETASLSGLPDIHHVQIFENHGALMGCSNPHPHCQVWATDHVPTIPARRRLTQRAHLAGHGRDLLGAYLELEVQRGERLVCHNEAWVALVPFWAVWPFEVLLIPRRRVGDLPGLRRDEREALAGLLGRLHARYDNLFRTSFPYSMAWHGQPCDGERDPAWRLHASYSPPLLRSASVRKFLVGYELSAEAQRDLTAEDAAAALRTQPDGHYLEPAHDDMTT